MAETILPWVRQELWGLRLILHADPFRSYVVEVLAIAGYYSVESFGGHGLASVPTNLSQLITYGTPGGLLHE